MSKLHLKDRARELRRETEDSERTITLVKKKTQAKKFNKNTTPVNIFKEIKDEPTKKMEYIKNQAESFNSDSNDYEISFSNKKVSSSDLEGSQRDKFDIDKSNEYQSNKDIFNKIEEVVILSESQCSSDLSFKQGFSTSLLDIYTLFKVGEDGNWLFRALSRVLYETEEYHVQIRTNIWDYIITHKARFSEFMEEGIH